MSEEKFRVVGPPRTVMSKAHFLTLVAKNAVVKTHGPKTKDWPENNFWAMVSTIKSRIKDEQIPQLMHANNISVLSDYTLPDEDIA
jgi:hypothetical protein